MNWDSALAKATEYSVDRVWDDKPGYTLQHNSSWRQIGLATLPIVMVIWHCRITALSNMHDAYKFDLYKIASVRHYLP